MIKLEKPDIDVKSIITDCIANLTKQPILTHINASKPTIVLKSEKYNVVDTYENSLSTYKKNLKDANKSKIMHSSVIVVISLIEMYLIIRSSFLSRVKEVGILRSIGIKRKDIYKMFMGEILSITLISSVPGLLFMSYVLYTLSKIEILNILINPLVFIISLLIVVFFNLIFGLLPVYRIVKKTPHEILSRNDVD